MDVSYIHETFKKIKTYLVFFCVVLTQGCETGDQVQIAQIDYEDQKAIGVTFITQQDVENLRVFIGDESRTSVIGVIVSVADKHSFTPVIPFTPGETYTLRKKDTVVMASFTIPDREGAVLNEVLGIYPLRDTVPENLLKMYLEFSQPMQEVGNALDFITVTNTTDSIGLSPFLRLESELWNKEHTVLTLWLDPGRIKTDLIPNREMGLPLTAGKTYHLQVNSNWKTRQGTPLKKRYTKSFFVGARDDRQPNVNEWQLRIPDAGAQQKLYIEFGEPMDAFLAQETMSIFGPKAAKMEGEFLLEKNQSTLVFTPAIKWFAGDYELIIQSRLEDLAGNNLNRLFDTNIEKATDDEVGGSTQSILFTVR